MIYTVIAVLTAVVDYITKLWAEKELIHISTIPIIKDVFHLTYVENRGMAFGMFSGARFIFIAVTAVIMIVLLTVLFKIPKKDRTIWIKLGTALCCGGAVGNLAERAFKGYVVDFLDFRIIDFPVFNAADIAICVGAAMIFIHFLFAEDNKK